MNKEIAETIGNALLPVAKQMLEKGICLRGQTVNRTEPQTAACVVNRRRAGVRALPFGRVAMKEALQSALILVLWVGFWLAGTLGGAVLQAWLVDIGMVSDIDPPWIITIGSSFIGFFRGAYAAIKLGDLTLRKKNS